jgi:parallel beta-helix repeat protein
MENRKLLVIVLSIVILTALLMPSLKNTSVTEGSLASPLATPVHNINTGLNYTTIQAAIDAPETLNGQTLRCDAGNYTENVHVYKSLKIIGAGSSVCTIIPFEPDDTIRDNVTGVTISGFTIRSVSGYSGVLVDKTSNCTISNNAFTGGGSGITLVGSNGNTVSSNEIDSLPGNGIELTNSSQENEVVSNNLNGNHYGIILLNASNYNEIADNSVNSTTWDGIRLNWQGSNYAPVAFNSIANNIVSYGYDGIFLDYPSSNNFVSSNFASNNNDGIRLRQASNSTITHNTVTSNTYGIYAETSANNRIYDNFLSNTNNAFDNGTDSWNTTKICMISNPNVIEGLYMGGNYWGDNPSHVDTDHDGLGDVPYNVPGGTNKDYLPLMNKTQNIVKIANPQRDTWYRITRAIYANGTIGPVDPLIIDLEAIGISPGGSYNWTISATETCFGEPSLVRVTWLSPDKISLTWNPPTTWASYPWQSPGSFISPLPNPYPGWPDPWYFSYSLLNITCEYNHPPNSNVTDSVGVVVEYGLAGEQSVRTLVYGEDVIGIGGINVELGSYKQDSDAYSQIATGVGGVVAGWGVATKNLWLIVGGAAWIAGTQIGEGIGNLIWPSSPLPAINPYMDVNQSNTYRKPWSIINRTAEVMSLLPPPNDNFNKAVFNTIEKTIDVDDLLEGLRVTYYRIIWAEKVGDENTMAMQQSTFKGFFREYIKNSQELQDVWQIIIGEVKAFPGDIYISPQNISDYQAKLWSTGFSVNETKIFNLFQINPWTIEQERQICCRFSPEKLSGNFSSSLKESIDVIGKSDQETKQVVFKQDNAVMDVTPLKTVVGQGYSNKINVTVYDGVPAEPVNITLYANQTIIGTLTNVTLPCGNCTTITFTWNTTGFAYGNYTISAYVTPVPGETDLTDNNYTGGTVKVTIPGDANGDGVVDAQDFFILERAWGTSTGQPNYDPRADFNGDGVVDAQDFFIMEYHWGLSIP